MTSHTHSPSEVSRDVASYLASFSGLYPCIWDWSIKISSEACEGKRGIFLVMDDSLASVLGVAITKRRRVGKLCHLSLHPKLRGKGMASRLAGIAIADLYLHEAREVIVTTSEPTFQIFGGFFRWLGFQTQDWHYGRYRRGLSEIIWSESAANLVDRLHERRVLEAHKTTFHEARERNLKVLTQMKTTSLACEEEISKSQGFSNALLVENTNTVGFKVLKTRDLDQLRINLNA